MEVNKSPGEIRAKIQELTSNPYNFIYQGSYYDESIDNEIETTAYSQVSAEATFNDFVIWLLDLKQSK